nr:sepiapterin reductase (EC 1.1.1.153) - mouse [Mus musculus]
LQTGRCPFAASPAVSGLKSHSPPAPHPTSTSAVCSLTLGPWRFPEPT